MAKTKNTKRALLMSALALLLCVSMFVGSTFAWFTDSVTSTGNIIQSGTLDVTMEWKDATATGTQQTYKDASLGAIFNYDLWEPGYVEAKNIKIGNAGTLALKYQLNIVATGEVSELANVIDVYYAEGEYTLADRNMSELTRIGTLKEVLAAISKTASGDLVAGESDTVTLALKMQETAGNEYQDLSIGSEFAVQLLATQLTFEDDSFNNQYDKDAVYGDVMVSSDAELKAAIEDPAMKVIAVNGDLTYDWGSESYENSKALNMKGKTFLGANDAASITFAGYGSANPIVDATFRNITIKDSTVGDNEASWEHGYLEFKNLTAVNVTFANSIMMEGDFATFKNCSFNSNKDGEYAVWVANGDATFEGCTFTGPRGVKVHEAYGSEVGTVVIDNNTFAGLTQKPGVAIGTVNAATTIKITNNVFAATQPGDQNNYKYETDTDVTTFNFVDENNTVNGALITTADQLAAVLESTDKNITAVLAADIDLPESVSKKMGGINTETITIVLNNHKLNVTTTYSSVVGAVNPDATITIKNGSMTSSRATGTWDLYDLDFVSEIVVENVTFEKSIALEKNATLKNVTINETHDYYAMWITAKGQTVTIDGLTINSAGRGIKIDEQYVDAPAKVTLNVSNATFKTAKKAAIMVKSAAGADIALDNVNIANTVDPVNAVWNDADASASFDKVTVNGGSVFQEQ